MQNFLSLPLGFEQNLGQAPENVRLLSHLAGYTALFSRGEVTLQFASLDGRQTKSEIIHLTFAGGDADVEPQGRNALPGVTNYYIGNDPSQWYTDIRQFREVRYPNVYPGIDLVFYGNHHQLEFDFDVAPGADPSAIWINVQGAALRKHGQSLYLATPSGNTAVLKSPELHQGTGKSWHRISGSYLLHRTQVGFAIGRYDREQQLVIDPALLYSTFTQVTNNALQPFAVAVDSSGNAYVTGAAETLDGTHFNAFVFKLDPTGSTLVYQTFLGGATATSRGAVDAPADGLGIAVDSSGNAYLEGMTHESDFPTTQGAYSTASLCANGAAGLTCMEPFAAKLNSSGTLVFSTFLVKPTALDTGGPVPSSMAIDSSGSIYVTGTTVPETNVAGLTTTSGAFQMTRSNNASAFVLKLHPDGSTLDYATYLGGSTSETPGGIAVDASGDAYVDGGTFSSNFPCTSPPVASGTSAFFTTLNPAGSAELSSTCLGGPSGEAEATSIAIDSSNAAYLTGMTVSGTFPQPQFGNFSLPAFAAKFNSSGTLVYSTLLGTNMSYGSSLTLGNPPQSFIAADSTGAAYVASGFGGFDNSSIVFSKLDPSTGAVVYSIPVGPTSASNSSFGGAALDSQLNFYVAGLAGDHSDPSGSGDLIPSVGTTVGAFQPLSTGTTQERPFLQKYAQSLGAAVAVPSPRLVTFSTILQEGNTSAPRTVTLSNYGDAGLTISNISISGANAGDFAIATSGNTCGTTVPDAPFGSSCSFQVTFTPTVASGTRNAVVNLSFGGGLASQTVALTGQAGFPMFQATPTPLGFGSVIVGETSSVQTITIQNTGTAPLHFLALPPAIVGPNAGDFAICELSLGHCQPDWTPPPPGFLAPGATATVPLVFTPTTTGTRTAQIEFQTDAPGSPQMVQLTGTGIPAGNGGFNLVAASGASTSATVNAGQTASYSLIVTGNPMSITMGCTGAPAGASCTASPNSFALTGNPGFSGSQSVSISVSTTSSSSASLLLNHSRLLWSLGAVFAILVGPRKRHLRRAIIGIAMLFALTAVVSCGGGSNGSGGGATGTPAGTFTLTVTASGNGVTNSLPLTLVVN